MLVKDLLFQCEAWHADSLRKKEGFHRSPLQGNNTAMEWSFSCIFSLNIDLEFLDFNIFWRTAVKTCILWSDTCVPKHIQ